MPPHRLPGMGEPTVHQPRPPMASSASQTPSRSQYHILLIHIPPSRMPRHSAALVHARHHALTPPRQPALSAGATTPRPPLPAAPCDASGSQFRPPARAPRRQNRPPSRPSHPQRMPPDPPRCPRHPFATQITPKPHPRPPPRGSHPKSQPHRLHTGDTKVQAPPTTRATSPQTTPAQTPPLPALPPIPRSSPGETARGNTTRTPRGPTTMR